MRRKLVFQEAVTTPPNPSFSGARNVRRTRPVDMTAAGA